METVVKTPRKKKAVTDVDPETAAPVKAKRTRKAAAEPRIKLIGASLTKTSRGLLYSNTTILKRPKSIAKNFARLPENTFYRRSKKP